MEAIGWAIRFLWWLMRWIINLSKPLTWWVYDNVLLHLLGVDRLLGMSRFAVMVPCVMVHTLIWGAVLASLYGGDLDMGILGALFGVWVGVGAGKYVANTLDYVRTQIEMEQPSAPTPMEELIVRGQSGPLDLSAFDDLVAAEADETQTILVDEEP